MKSQSPIGTNKTLAETFRKEAKKRKSQSPIGTNKTHFITAKFKRCVLVSIPYRYKQNCYINSRQEYYDVMFQSPIGTNKTRHIYVWTGTYSRVSIPYR